MTKQEEFDYIIETYINGNITHSFLKVNDFGINDFVCYLEDLDILSIEEKFGFLTKYLKFNFK